MKKIILSLLISFFGINCYSQNDTLYLEKGYVELRGEQFNKTSISGDRIDKWIEYGMHVYIVMDCEEWLESGDGFHIRKNIEYEYRPLKEGEYYGIRYLISEVSDTINEDIRYYQNYIEIRNKIAPDLYYIKAKGKYKENKKDGEWKFNYSSGNILKRILYKNGVPVSSFNIYRENGSTMIEIVKNSHADWTMTKYNTDGLQLETVNMKTEEFEVLY